MAVGGVRGSDLKFGQMSREQSDDSLVMTTPSEYFQEDDYSQNIASAVASILAENPEPPIDSSLEVWAVGSSSNLKPKRGLKKKKSKHKLRATRSSTTNIGGHTKPLKVIRARAKTQGSEQPPSNQDPLVSGQVKVKDEGKPPIPTQRKSKLKRLEGGSSVNVFRPPHLPSPLTRNPNMLEVNLYLARVQEYINKLGYQRLGEPKIRVKTHMSLKHQIDTAKLLTKAGQPIKCLHALVIAIYLTNCTPLIERFTINFKSTVDGKEYKHVVLGIYLYGYFGALGISRDVGLQDKPASFSRLSELIAEFKKSYADSGHVLTEVRIGGIIPHDPHSSQPINWKLGVIGSKAEPLEDTLGFDRIAKTLRLQMGAACLRQARSELCTFLTTSSKSVLLEEGKEPGAALVKKTSSSTQPRMLRKTGSRTRTSAANLSAKKKSSEPVQLS